MIDLWEAQQQLKRPDTRTGKIRALQESEMCIRDRFTTIFTLGSGLIDTVQDQNIRKAGGDGQAVLNYISDEAVSYTHLKKKEENHAGGSDTKNDCPCV